MDFRILIVEDEARLREVVCDYFRSRGDTPFEAENGLRALELIEDAEFDAVWSVLYSDPDALPKGAETVTLYARRAEVCINEPSPAFSFDGKDYSGLADFVSKIGPGFKDGCETILDYLASDELCVSVFHSYKFDGGKGYSSNI